MIQLRVHPRGQHRAHPMSSDTAPSCWLSRVDRFTSWRGLYQFLFYSFIFVLLTRGMCSTRYTSGTSLPISVMSRSMMSRCTYFRKIRKSRPCHCEVRSNPVNIRYSFLFFWIASYLAMTPYASSTAIAFFISL